MITLVRYQAELLLRSHRWIGPVVCYALFVWFAGGTGGGSQQLGAVMSWTAAALVPVVAWLTRQMLTAEPGEARSCVAAAGGPRRVQVAALIAALAAGMVLGLAGVIFDLAAGRPSGDAGGYARTIAVGLAAALICAAVGSAIGALCNPPVVRTVAGAALSTIGIVVAALVSSVSPANAAIRVAGTQPHASAWPVGPSLIAALALLAVAWTVSALLAARRGL